MKGEHSAMPDAAVAHYHLPGLFEFYDFYRAFLPLYRRHREYFYDWCDIASLYGAPEGCLWGGGRIGSGNCDPRDVLALTREYGISARLTFSNSLLRPEHLADRGCNRLCRLFAGSADPQNGVIVHSELLLEHLRSVYPELYQGELIPSRAFAEGGIHEAIMAYEDNTFFEILAQELALRDMDDPPITEENYDEVMSRMDEYLGEFERHGTDNITVDMES